MERSPVPGLSAVAALQDVRELSAILLDADGGILACNSGAEAIYGYPAGQVIGMHVSKLAGAVGESSKHLLELAARQGRCRDAGWRVRKDGTRFWADVVVTAIRAADGSIGGYLELSQDFTRQRDDFHRLLESETRLRQIVDQAVDGIITIDERGVIESVNPAVQRIFGYAGEELIGRNVAQLMPSPYRQEHDRYIANYLRTGERKVIGIGREAMALRRDGTVFPVDLSVSEVQIGGRRLFTGIIRDITDRRRSEQERERLLQRERDARAEAERASRAKDEFLAALSHELRTPLTPALLLLSSLQTDTSLSQPVRDELAMIRRNVQLEARLIDDLLDLTRVVNRKITLAPEVIDLHDLVKRAVEISHQHQSGAPLEFELVATQHHVDGDPTRLQQVIWNLLSNALKFTPLDGKITIRTMDAADGRVRLEVSDTGRGIDPAVMPAIFLPFEQGDANTARQFGGLGLGLPIAKAIVEAHGGSIAAHSAGRGRGSTFRVDLPVADPSKSSAASPSTAFPAPVQPLRILLVEDHEMTLHSLSLLLRQLGHEVFTASSVAQAMDMASGLNINVLISDLGLPDGSGYDVMRKLGNLTGVKGIALSGYGMSEDVQRSKEAGFAQHLTKPIDIEMLALAVRQLAAD